MQYPSVNASKFSDKAVHDYSLTKKADNPIDNTRINISRVTLAFCRQYSMWNTVKSFTEVKEKTLTKSVVLSNHTTLSKSLIITLVKEIGLSCLHVSKGVSFAIGVTLASLHKFITLVSRNSYCFLREE